MSEAEDKLAIQETLTRYMMAVDQVDGDALRACFTPDADIGFGSPISVDDFCALSVYTQQHVKGMHMVMNFVIDVDGDTARAFSYLMIYTRVPGNCPEEQIAQIFGKYDRDTVVLSGGYYNDALVRDGKLWRISKRELNLLWQQTMDAGKDKGTGWVPKGPGQWAVTGN